MEIDISFSKDVFMKDDFDVDKFLQESYQKSGLHKLHKELGIYIKYLQSMIIDLVNNESNAIVNLSSDLKVLQNKFDSLSTPLGQFREEILQLYKMIDTNLNSIKYLLSKKDSVVAEKSRKLNELRMLATSQKIENILESQKDSQNIEMEIIERSVNQYILQHMYSELCDSQNYDLKTTEKLYTVLNNIFLSSFREKNNEKCTRCLQMYVLMNAQEIAENLYKLEIVRPAFHEIITENNLKNFGNDLSKIYDKIIDFIEKNTSYLQNLIEKREELTGFDFILNSVWTEASEQLKLDLSEIFAPGNPSVFQLRYRQTCNFLYDLESRVSSKLKSHHTYRTYLSHWNLTIYFEIRHLEIVEDYEKSLKNVVSDEIFEEKGDFRISPFSNAWKAMEKCFEEKIFLPQLLDKFWKLVLQIISRLHVWVSQILQKNIPIQSSEQNLDLNANLKLKFLTFLHTDITFIIGKLSGDLDFTKNCIPEKLREKVKLSLRDFTEDQFPSDLRSIKLIVIENLYKDCSQHVKNVSQIPRLYRKTNRTAPTTPSTYINSMLRPTELYQTEYSKYLSPETLREILQEVHDRITKEFVTLVNSVLTSVAKTEESLRRLKKSREPQNTTETSDDQKIRMQLQIDVETYAKVAKNYCDVAQLIVQVKDVTPPRE